MGMSSQRCPSCSRFIYGADVGGKPIATTRRRGKRRTWRSVFTTARSQALADSIDPDSIQHDKKSFSLWVPVLIALACIFVIALTNYYVKRGQNELAKTEPDVVLQTSLLGKGSEQKKSALVGDAKLLEAAEIDPEWARKVTATASAYLSTVRVDELIAMTRNGPKFEKEIRAAFAEPERLPLSVDGIDEILYSMSDNGSKNPLGLLFFVNRLDAMQGIVLVETPDGVKVDWPTLSGLGELTIAEFLQQKPTEPKLLRVAARRVDYYNYDYRQEDDIQAVRLTEFPEEHVFYGYVKKNSPLYDRVKGLPEHEVGSATTLATPPRPLTIRAKFREGSKSRDQVDIVEVLGNGWYVE
jgi:hypothetical protein